MTTCTASVTLIATIVTAAATFCIAYFTYKLSSSTKKLWNATNTLSSSTEKLWKATKDSFETTERAFVYMGEFGKELATLADLPEEDWPNNIPSVYENHPNWYITRFAIQPKWGNAGTTPTKGMTIRIDFGETEEACPPNYVYRNYRGGNAQTFFLPPKAIQGGEFIEIPDACAHITRQLQQSALQQSAKNPKLLIWGCADYLDIFGSPHSLKWCYQIRFDAHKGKDLGVTYIQWGEHNCTD